MTLVAALSCAGPRAGSSPAIVHERALRIGINTDSPPYAFYRDQEFAGLEIDLAGALGNALGRPIEFADVGWDNLFDALLQDRVDIVMAGVTITRDREVRVAFGTPYLRTTIAAVVQRRDVKRFRNRDEVCRSPIDVGVVSATMGEKFLRTRCPAMLPRLYPTARDAVRELRQGRIDAVVGDRPVMLWLLSQHESELGIVETGIGDQQLAWAFRPDDTALRERADEALATMRADGTLDRIVDHWVPSGPR